MKKLIFITIFLVNCFSVECQTSKPIISLNPMLENGTKYFHVSISNNSDSVLYLLHSCFFKKGNQQNSLVEYGRDTSLSYYSMRFMNDDIRYDFGKGCFRSTAILPNQILKFKAETNVKGYKEFEFLIDYFYSDNYNHEEFRKEVLLSDWFEKYDWKELRMKPIVR